MNQPLRYTVTSALPYANGPLHIGHIAGAYLPADIYVRYLRSSGKEVAFICGSDEHGAAITIRAKKEGISPREIVDKYHAILRDSFVSLGINFDIYHRTSSPEHHQMAGDFFLELYRKGIFEEKSTEQYYDEEAGQFLADRYITGTCPKCSNEKAYGDQCESCGSTLSPTELIHPVSTLSGNAPVLRKTSHWYLPLHRFQDWLKAFIEEGEDDGIKHHYPEEWKHHVLGQCRSWIDGGLHERAMTRDLDWGVKVPLKDAEGKVLYVWLDAPIGYITATKAWAESKGEDWEKWWKSEDSRLIHFIGKDNIVFHCLIFPALLKAHGNYILPYNVPAMEFMNLEGEKISTSRDWAVWIHEYVKEFEGKEDVLRYVLCALMPEQKDSEFTWNDYKERNNNELADVLGNFINRVVVLSHNYFDGVLPEPGTLDSDAQNALDSIEKTANKVGSLIASFKFREALNETMGLARIGNKYMTDAEPWKVIKTDLEKVKSILFVCNQIAANLAIVLQPFLPFTAEKLAKCYGLTDFKWSSAGADLLPSGRAIGNPGILFAKIDNDLVNAQIAKLTIRREAMQKASLKAAPIKDESTFDDFSKIDIRTGVILEAERVPKAKKLLKLTIDIGVEKRTVVSGIAEFYEPENIIGQQVCFLANLAPREIRGVVSQGMVLMAEQPDGTLAFVQAPSDFSAGSVVR
jgi:methionyl-tRNA synthetase